MSSFTVAELLVELGGVARRSALLRVVSRGDLDRAVDSALVVRDARGLYAVPEADEAARIAAQIGGVLSMTSAALRHGWGVKTVPARPYVTVSRGRQLNGRVGLAHIVRAELSPQQIVDGVTTEEVTLRDCLRRLPFDEALSIADSALRVTGCRSLLDRIAEEARGPGSIQIRRVAAEATPKAANPFESVARSICVGVRGLRVEPQVMISDGAFSARVDLVDVHLGIAVEADSFEWHGQRSALALDCRRYNRMVIGGWIVLRFTYEDVMFHPEEVREVLMAAVALAELMKQHGLRAGSAA